MDVSDIVKLRKKKGLSQVEFWSRIGVTQSAGSRYESGRRLSQPVVRLLTLVYGTEKQSQAMLAKLRTFEG